MTEVDEAYDKGCNQPIYMLQEPFCCELLTIDVYLYAKCHAIV